MNFSFIDESGMSAVSMWIVGDFEKESGRKLLLSAVRHMVSNMALLFILCTAVLPLTYSDASKMKCTLLIHDR